MLVSLGCATSLYTTSGIIFLQNLPLCLARAFYGARRFPPRPGGTKTKVSYLNLYFPKSVFFSLYLPMLVIDVTTLSP